MTAPVQTSFPRWYIACSSRDLGTRPLSRVIAGVPVVLFRDRDGRVGALLDRCPHRNVPLSLGRVREGELECRYHGWRFDCSGSCVAVPGLIGEAGGKGRDASRFFAREQQGFVWVSAHPDEPTEPPYPFPFVDDRSYSTVRQELFARGSVHALLENTLDVPHTAFLHGGFFRTAKKEHEIDVVVRRSGDRIEAEYIGEPRPKGLVGWLLAPGGGVVTHFDRFILPSIAQVEYRLGEGSHLIVTTAMTPISDSETRAFAVATFRVPLPSFLIRPFVTPVARHIFNQDAEILRHQSESIARFGGEHFVSTEIDVLGLQIARMLRHLEATGRPLEGTQEHRLRMRV